MLRNAHKYLLLGLISVLATFIHGYVYSSGDQALYVPFIALKQNPNLFKHDILSSMAEQHHTIFFNGMRLFLSTTNLDLEWTYFILYNLIHFLITITTYHLAILLGSSSKTALIATIILVVPKYVGGTTITTIDVSFLPRLVAQPFFLISFIYAFKKRYNLSLIINSLVLLLHPFSAISLFSFVTTLMIFNRKYISLPKAILLILPATVYIWRQKNLLTSPLMIPPDWWDILVSRVPYNFLSMWQISGWLSLSSALIICVIGMFLKPNKSIKTTLSVVVTVSIVISLIHLLGAELLKLSPVSQLQLPRIWLLPTIISYILIAQLVNYLWKKPKLVFKLISIIFFWGAITNGRFFLQPRGIELPHSDTREWVIVQKWIKANTPEDATILTPPQRIGFRIHSQRSIVVEVKDGSSSLYSYDFAKSWQQRLVDAQLLSFKTTTESMNLAQKYHASYLVTFTKLPHPSLEELFRTQTFVVYKL